MTRKRAKTTSKVETTMVEETAVVTAEETQAVLDTKDEAEVTAVVAEPVVEEVAVEEAEAETVIAEAVAEPVAEPVVEEPAVKEPVSVVVTGELPPQLERLLVDMDVYIEKMNPIAPDNINTILEQQGVMRRILIVGLSYTDETAARAFLRTVLDKIKTAPNGCFSYANRLRMVDSMTTISKEERVGFSRLYHAVCELANPKTRAATLKNIDMATLAENIGGVRGEVITTRLKQLVSTF